MPDPAPFDPAEFDPADLDPADPSPLLARLRRAARVLPLANGFVVVTGHEEALEVLRHPACGSSPIALRYLDRLPAGAARDEMGHRINFLDPPDHPRVRGLVSKAFTPRRVEAIRPWMERTADELIDRVAATPDDDGTVDLLARFAHQLPSLVISELLGVPIADRDRLTGWSDAVAPLLGVEVSGDDLRGAVAAAESFHDYLGALLDERRAVPGNDLLSALVTAEDDGDRLERVELLSLAATLYSAGHRTTRDLFTNGMSELLADPARWGRVVDGTWAVPDVVSEFLRHDTPTLYVARVALADVAIGGITVPAGSPVLVYLSAANRDPMAYEDPDGFRPGRGGPPNLSFAFGAHYCIGASLARSEAETMLATLVRRVPGLSSAGRPLRWHLRGPFRGLDELRVLTAGATAHR